MSSITYYNKNAQLFYERTKNGCAPELRKRFIEQINPSARILDAGCGVGSDSRYFEQIGHHVTAFDGAEEMVKRANQILKNPARLLLLQDMNFCEEFDGIWAAASLIHIPPYELKDVVRRLAKALKSKGILFANFKHGKGEYMQEERTFYYMTEPTLRDFLKDQFEIIDIWTTEDYSHNFAHSPDKRWLNVLGRKKD